MTVDVSIIIVNYNTRAMTLQALESIFCSETDNCYEVILVDNSSSDDSVASIRGLFPCVQIIENRSNVGFATANNQGIRISSGRYVLLLNSDTRIERGTLQSIIEFMDEQPLAGASGCKVLLPDGQLDPACKRGFPTPLTSLFYVSGVARLCPRSAVLNRYHMGHLSADDTNAVDAIVGAFMVVRRNVIDQVGLLDEEYFMYGEDIDWCYRIKQAGWQVYYYPQTQIMHYKGGSSSRRPPWLVREFYRAMLLFYKKHYQHMYNPLVSIAVRAGIGLAMSLALIRNSVKRARVIGAGRGIFDVRGPSI